ncbi:hypothetical protein KKB18_02980 [bacterium]|nr:hypothetical protein [bacterium]
MSNNSLIPLPDKAIETATETVCDFLKLLFKPGLEEIGGLFGDIIKYWRLKCNVNIWEKTKKLFIKKNIKIDNLSPVAPKILFPLLVNCS